MLFAEAPYHAYKDPLDRVLGYIDFRRALLTGEVPDFTPASSARAVQEIDGETIPPSATPATTALSGTRKRSKRTLLKR